MYTQKLFFIYIVPTFRIAPNLNPKPGAQRTAANIPVDGVEHKLLLSLVFLLPPKNKEKPI